MLKKTATTIHKLRVFFLLGFSVVFLIQLQMNPLDFGRYLGARFSDAIGMSVAVPENPDNRLARELKERSEELDAREQELAAREDSLKTAVNQELSGRFQWYFWTMGVGILLLFVLIAVNFYLDYKRRQILKNAKKDIV